MGWSLQSYLKGPTGYTGYTGPVGASIVIKGTVSTYEYLPSTGNTQNDAWVVSYDGHIYVWNGSTWNDVGQFIGATGYTGYTGADSTVTGPFIALLEYELP